MNAASSSKHSKIQSSFQISSLFIQHRSVTEHDLIKHQPQRFFVLEDDDDLVFFFIVSDLAVDARLLDGGKSRHWSNKSPSCLYNFKGGNNHI